MDVMEAACVCVTRRNVVKQKQEGVEKSEEQSSAVAEPLLSGKMRSQQCVLGICVKVCV